MLAEDYARLQGLIQGQLPDGLWFQDRSTDKHDGSSIGKVRFLGAYYSDYKCRAWHNGIQLDIFVLREDGENLVAEKGHGFYFGRKIAKSMIFPRKELKFEDIQVYVPHNYTKYCTDAWGGCPPPALPEHKQVPHEGRISFHIPAWMKRKYPHLYSSGE